MAQNSGLSQALEKPFVFANLFFISFHAHVLRTICTIYILVASWFEYDRKQCKSIIVEITEKGGCNSIFLSQSLLGSFVSLSLALSFSAALFILNMKYAHTCK